MSYSFSEIYGFLDLVYNATDLFGDFGWFDEVDLAPISPRKSICLGSLSWCLGLSDWERSAWKGCPRGWFRFNGLTAYSLMNWIRVPTPNPGEKMLTQGQAGTLFPALAIQPLNCETGFPPMPEMVCHWWGFPNFNQIPDSRRLLTIKQL